MKLKKDEALEGEDRPLYRYQLLSKKRPQARARISSPCSSPFGEAIF
jgi:hypothetical protein